MCFVCTHWYQTNMFMKPKNQREYTNLSCELNTRHTQVLRAIWQRIAVKISEMK